MSANIIPLSTFLLQYRERVVFIGQHIDEEFSNQILASMLYLDSVDDSKKLFMYINGPGGDVSSSLTTCINIYTFGLR